jgi:hypothetical protein
MRAVDIATATYKQHLPFQAQGVYQPSMPQLQEAHKLLLACRRAAAGKAMALDAKRKKADKYLSGSVSAHRGQIALRYPGEFLVDDFQQQERPRHEEREEEGGKPVNDPGSDGVKRGKNKPSFTDALLINVEKNQFDLICARASAANRTRAPPGGRPSCAPIRPVRSCDGVWRAGEVGHALRRNKGGRMVLERL